MLCKFLTIACPAMLMLSAGHARSAESDKMALRRSQAGFLQLFDGKDLKGWDGDPAFWSVEDGAIAARVGPEVNVENHSYLIWQGRMVRDFELNVMVRSTQGNSGIDYRAEPVPADRNDKPLKWTIQGYQSDISKDWMGSLYNWGRQGAQPSQFVVVTGAEPVSRYIGSVVDKQALYGIGYYKPDQWNLFTIIARGSHILHRINGYPVAEFIDNSSDTRRQGVLGLQVHTGRGPFLNEFKDIRLRQFDVNFGQAELLFNGKDLSGWSFSEAAAETAWAVRNDVLVGKGKSQGHILTNDDYTDYVLRFQYRRLGEHKGGVLLRLRGTNEPQSSGIRIYGDGDDFNQVTDKASPSKLRKQRPNAPAFRTLPEAFWNECEIVLNQGKLDVKVNDVLRAAAEDCTQSPGKIGFETSDEPVEYRNIVIIPILSADNPSQRPDSSR